MDTPRITKNETFTGDLHSVLLECTVNGAPTPQIHWKKDGARFSDQSAVLILNKNQSYSGEYSCMANNPVGLKSASVDVKLYCEYHVVCISCLLKQLIELIVLSNRLRNMPQSSSSVTYMKKVN